MTEDELARRWAPGLPGPIPSIPRTPRSIGDELDAGSSIPEEEG